MGQCVFAAELADAAAEYVHLGKAGRLQQPTHFGRGVETFVGVDRVRLARIVGERQFGTVAKSHQIKREFVGRRPPTASLQKSS